MRRCEIIEALVLNEVSDDYEDIEHVIEGMDKSGVVLDPVASRQEVENAVGSLIRSGHIQAYVLRSFPPLVNAVEGVPEGLDRYWFHQTEKGKLLNLSMHWPPETFGR